MPRPLLAIVFALTACGGDPGPPEFCDGGTFELRPSGDARAAIAPLHQVFDGAKASEAAARREVFRSVGPAGRRSSRSPPPGFVRLHSSLK